MNDKDGARVVEVAETGAPYQLWFGDVFLFGGPSKAHFEVMANILNDLLRKERADALEEAAKVATKHGKEREALADHSVAGECFCVAIAIRAIAQKGKP